MRATIKIASAVLLLASVATMLLVLRQYRYGSSVVQRAYATVVDNHDILDSARKAFASVADAELRAENYVLTGETVYLESFKDDQRIWQDESGTLETLAEKGKLKTLSQDLNKSGSRTMDELAAVIAIYEKSGRDPALDRIRKSSSIVYLDQAQKALAAIVGNVGIGVEGNSRAVSRTLASMARVAQFAGALFGLAFIAAILSFLGWRAPSP